MTNVFAALVLCPLLWVAAKRHLCKLKAYRVEKKTLGSAYKVGKLVTDGVCKYLSDAPGSRMSLGRWGERAAESLAPLVDTLSNALVHHTNISMHHGWKWLHSWLHRISLESEAFEVRALSAPIMERLWSESLYISGALGNSSVTKDGAISPQVAEIINDYKLAGRINDAERFFLKAWDFQEGPGVYPYRFLYDLKDFRRVVADVWPGLKKLDWPDPHDVLPPSVGEKLTQYWQQIAGDAKKLMGKLIAQDDAAPHIVGGRQWTELSLYDVHHGWNFELCESLRLVCKILYGKMRSETGRGMAWRKKGYLGRSWEEISLYRVRGPGFAHLHYGMGARVNVHLCLVNCNESRIVVGGETRDYFDGSFFAFEDRLDHEIENAAQGKDRINLVVAVLHPDFDLDKEPYPTPQQQLRYVLTSVAQVAGDHLSQKALGRGLLFASLLGYASVAEQVLNLGAHVDAADMDGAQPIHAACSRGRTDVVRLLLAHRANTEALDANGQRPLELAAKRGSNDIVQMLKEHGKAMESRGQPRLPSASQFQPSTSSRSPIDYHLEINRSQRLLDRGNIVLAGLNVTVSGAWVLTGGRSGLPPSFVFVLDGVTTDSEQKALANWVLSADATQNRKWLPESTNTHLDLRHDALDHDMDYASPVQNLYLYRIRDIVWSLLGSLDGYQEHVSAGRLEGYRAYTNKHGPDGTDVPHCDFASAAKENVGVTAVYYTQTDQRAVAGGHTMLYDARCSSLHADEGELQNSSLLEVALAVRPKLHRLLLFDSKIVHHGTGPSHLSSVPRLSTVFKWAARHGPEPSSSMMSPRVQKRKKRATSHAKGSDAEL